MAQDLPVNIDTTISADAPVSIDTATPGAPLPSSTTAEVRSKKAAMGLGEILGKSDAEIYAGISRGEEQNLRVQASQRLDAMNDQARIDYLIKTVKDKNLTLDVNQMEALRKRPTDPNAVFEENYASKFIDGIYKAAANIGGTALDSATIDTPDAVKADIDKAKSAFGNIEYARTKLENIQDLYENQGWVPWIADQAKNIIPFYSDVKLRGWMENTPAFGFQLQGSNLYEQTRELLRLPGPEFRAKLDEILGKLSNDNPTLAVQYANAVVGMSYFEQNLASVNNIIDLTAVPGIGTSAVRALRNVNTVRGALRDGIKASGTARPDAASVAEGFGDTATAAVERGTQIVQDKIDGVYRPATNTANTNTINDPIRRAKESLPTNYVLDKNEIAANPGPLSRELLTRILQQQDVASNRILTVIENTARIQQIPLEEASRAVMTVVKEEVKNQHPGIKNAILDVGDPVYNPFGNNYNFPVRIGNWTGEQFSSEAVARRFAKEHGIIEYDVAGKPGARAYIPEAAIKRDWETQPRLGEVTLKDGLLKVHTDDGAEVAFSLKPQIGHIPISVAPDGKVTFHPTIKTEGDLTKAVVDQQGLGFHLITWKPLDTTQSVLKDMTLSLESTKSIVSKGGVMAWVDSIPYIRPGYMRSSDNTLSPFEIHQRKTGTYSISNYQQLLQDEMKMVEDIARGRVRVDPVTGEDINSARSWVTSLAPWNKKAAKQQFAEFTRALDYAREAINPETKKPGYFFQNPAQINDFYLRNFDRPASFQEIQGYHAFVRNYENDRVLRSLREYANKVRLGAEQHSVKFTDEAGNVFKSDFFDGVSRKELPRGEYPILDLTGQKPIIKLSNQMGGRYKELVQTVSRGEDVVVELYNPELRPMQTIPGVGTKYVRYVVVPGGKRETKNLSWEQVNRLSGGHFEYDHDLYLKEANMRRDVYGSTTIDRYEGDKTFMALDNGAQGKEVARVLNEVKRLLKAKDVEQAKRVFEEGLPGATGPAMEWKDFYSRTRPTKDKNGVLHPPQINVNEPYYVVPKNRSIIDLGGELQSRYSGTKPNGVKFDTFQDGTRSGSLARQYQVAFTQERDNEGLMVLRAEGTKGNPIYKYEPARFVDPITTMNRALNQIVNSTFMDDMKIAGIETWLREAEPFLKKELRDRARAAPFSVFKDAKDASAFATAADRVKVANLLSNRFKTEQFFGTPSAYDTFMHDTSQRIADTMYDKMGPKGLLIPEWMMSKIPQGIKDAAYNPVAFTRSFAYHAKMGVFAIPQIFTQLQSYTTIATVAPRSAPGGTLAATLHQWLKFNSSAEMLDHLDQYANMLNIGERVGVPLFHRWKPGQFKEAFQALEDRGFGNKPGGEYSPLNTQLKHQYIKGEWGAFLDAGQIFFKNTEQHVKYGAWYTAALEYRAENPGIKVMSRTDWAKVLDRADDLSGNMSRASASILQSGPLALTGQFLTYQMHMAELFWGKRLADTTGERAMARTRMLLGYSALYGVPMGVGITGLPLADYLRKAAIDNGYVIGDNWLSSVLAEGVPALFAAWATSSDGDIKKSNWYNFSKFGSGGFTQANQLADGKWWEFLGGASGSIMGNTIKNSSGFVRSVASMLPGSGQEEAFPMKIDDFVDIFKEVSSVNQAWKGTVAVSTGKWLSKNEAYQGDVSKANAIFMALTGTDLANAADNYNVGQLIKDQTEKQKYALSKFTREYRRGVMAAENNDWSGYNDYMRRSFGYLKAMNYPEDKYASAIAIASKGYEERILSIREQFYTKNVPAGKEQQRFDDYTRFLKTQEPPK